jgi:chemotaxis-related protein WspB
MLFLTFEVGSDRYAVEASRIVEVLALHRVKALPQAPRGVAGVIDYRGRAIPVIDLCAAMTDRPSRARVSTRIVVVRYDASDRMIALIAERATETVRIDRAQFQSSGVALESAPYLGAVASVGGALIQWVEPSRLIPENVRDALFRRASEVAA